MFLSLPIPEETEFKIDIVYIPYVPSQRQLKMTIHLSKDATISQLKQEIENIVSPSVSISDDHSVSELNI